MRRLGAGDPELLKDLIGSRWQLRDDPEIIVEVVGEALPHEQHVVAVRSGNRIHRLNRDGLLSKYRRVG